MYKISDKWWRLTPIIKGSFTVSIKYEMYSKSWWKNLMIEIWAKTFKCSYKSTLIES